MWEISGSIFKYYTEYMHTDGYSGYNGVKNVKLIVEGCPKQSMSDQFKERIKNMKLLQHSRAKVITSNMSFQEDTAVIFQ